MTTVIEQRVKVFLDAWNLRGGELDTTASCQVCGRDLVDGKFALVDGVLICLECRERDLNRETPQNTGATSVGGSADHGPSQFKGKDGRIKQD